MNCENCRHPLVSHERLLMRTICMECDCKELMI